MMSLEPYNEQSELEDIKLRYTNVQHMIPYTLKRLQQSPIFLSIVERLKSEGWKEWHILQAIGNGVMNWYTERSGANHDIQRIQDEGKAVFQRLFEEGEAPHDPPIPLDYFTLEAMHVWLHTGLLTFLSIKGAVFGPRGYFPERLQTIAKNRYHYFELDVPHSPIFPSKSNEQL
jgi:hypothetical protein